MATAWIDLDAMADLISTLETAAYCLHTVPQTLRPQADRADVPTTALTGLDHIASWVDDELPGLRRRLNLAIAADAQRSTAFRGTPVQITEPTLTTTQAQALGTDLAVLLRDLGPDTGEPGLAQIGRLEEAVRLLQEHAGDPDVMASMFAGLGAQGVVDLPSQLRRLAEAAAVDGAGWLDIAGEPVDTAVLRDQVTELQQSFLEALGTGLAGATRIETFGDVAPGFAQELVEQATSSPDWGGWGLAQVLRYGGYDTGFLVDVGEGLYAWEKASHTEAWTQRPGYGVMDWRLGTDDQGQYYDPFVGLFQAMSRNPAAAVDFLNPSAGTGRAEGEEVLDRVRYFVSERAPGGPDDLASLAATLDAASGHFHTITATTADQTRSAWVASAAVHAFAERGGTTPGAADAMARLLGRYVVDVDRIANGRQDETLGVYDQAFSSWHVGLPVGAGMNATDLRVVLRGVLVDADAAGILADKAARWNAYRLNWAAEHSTPGDPSSVQTAVENGAQLNGFLLGVADADQEARASEADAGVTSLLSAFAALKGLVRAHPATRATLGLVIGQAQTAATQKWATSAQDVAAGNIAVRDAAQLDYQIGVLRVLEAHGLVAPEALSLADGGDLSFMNRSGVSEQAEDVPQMREDVRQWLDEDRSEGLPREMRDEAADGYAEGDAWGRSGA